MDITSSSSPFHQAELPADNIIYLWFAFALLCTAVGSFTGFSLLQTTPQLFNNPVVLYGAIAIELILVFTARLWSEKVPLAYGMFFLYTFLSGFTLTPILLLAGAVGGASLISQALFSSAAVFFVSAVFAWTTNKDFSGIGRFLYMALIGLIIFSLIGIFFPWSNTTEIMVSGFTVVLFTGFTLYDLQNIKNQRYQSAIIAALHLYLDFINIFVSLLRLFIAFRGRD